MCTFMYNVQDVQKITKYDIVIQKLFVLDIADQIGGRVKKMNFVKLSQPKYIQLKIKTEQKINLTG